MSEILAGGPGITIPTAGSDLSTWGTVLNTYTFPLFQKLIDGSVTIVLSGTSGTITSTNGVDNQYRNRAWSFSGQSGAYTLTIPGNETAKIVNNTSASYGITFNAGGTTATLGASKWGILLVTASGNCTVLDPTTLTTVTPADNLFRIVGSGDATKKLAFEVDGITTATTRTVTVPDVSGVAVLDGAGQTTIASATTTDLGASKTRDVVISGTVTITGFGTVAAGTLRVGYFSGALTLTYNATSLILPSAANITTANGDSFQAVSLGSGNWKVLSYTKADGTPVVAGATTTLTLLGTLTTTSGTTQSLTGIAAGYRGLWIEIDGVSWTASITLQIALSSTNGSAYGAARPFNNSSGGASGAVSGGILIMNISSTVAGSRTAIGQVDPAGGITTANSVVLATDTAAVVNAIQFSGGTFDAGSIRIYGMK